MKVEITGQVLDFKRTYQFNEFHVYLDNCNVNLDFDKTEIYFDHLLYETEFIDFSFATSNSLSCPLATYYFEIDYFFIIDIDSTTEKIEINAMDPSQIGDYVLVFKGVNPRGVPFTTDLRIFLNINKTEEE
eukprot:CAMPEP_0170567020 /NCGR_PEP_ID=MMETSP0211-20121228/80215_1 /TAXON_ID=311385 /ORGANISM="Pseudokeronopsis sp., Strain OXSARD2" /LENGTH=130 /DNA_ID=CAMNT_0010888369 /DNA_START=1144 /DNA_END=1536 /DNA_ORIENTATION=+